MIIKFKGLTINGRWVCGLLSESKGYAGQPEKGFYISNSAGMPWAYQVRPETVGQFIGLYERVKVGEGDDYIDGKEMFVGDVQIGNFWNDGKDIYVKREGCIVFDRGICYLQEIGGKRTAPIDRYSKIIGNIHDKADVERGKE